MDTAADWVKGLTSHRAGRLLSNHLACVELETREAAVGCAVTEALNNEKAFVHTLSHSLEKNWSLPCGLPSPLPRFIALLNLSGERMLAYSDNAALIQCLCTKSRLRGDVLDKAINQFVHWPSERTILSGKFVLLSYSLPWQAGTDAAFWHLSACEVGVTEDGRSKMVVDRVKQFSSVATAPFRGKSLRDETNQTIQLSASGQQKVLPVVGVEELKRFVESYSAVNLDLKVASASRSTGKTGELQEETLRETLELLRRGRVKDQKELDLKKGECDALKNALEQTANASNSRLKEAEEKHACELKEAIGAKDRMLDLCRSQRNALAAEVEVTKASERQLSDGKQKEARDHKRMSEKYKELLQRSAAKDKLHNATMAKNRATITQLEGLVSTKDERIETMRSELEAESCATVANMQREHEEVVERLNGSLESKKRIINQLSENNDRKEVEKVSLQTHADEQSVRVRDLEAELADFATECKRLDGELKRCEADLKKQRQAAPPAPKLRNRAVSTHSRNASTATHHCASTQTINPPATPPATPLATPSAPAPAPVTAVGQLAPAPQAVLPFSLQAAINMLQEHVTLTTQGQAQVVQHSMPQAFRPLPFPHFTPTMVAYQHTTSGNFHAIQQPQLQPHYVHPKAYPRPAHGN
tara:strand:+ start:3035 stop:4975 length:1941 start_codon:yes stop_codon:yes gene_type:complete